MDLLEVIDSAIKIGLGAIIGVLGSYILNWQKHKQEIEKDNISENRKTLKELGKLFEGIHTNIVLLTRELLESEGVAGDSSDSLYDLANRFDQINEEKTLQVVNDRVKELIALQGVLMLNGYKWMSAIIYDYAFIARGGSRFEERDERFFKDEKPDIYLHEIRGLIERGNVLEKFKILRNMYYKAGAIYLNDPTPNDKEIYQALISIAVTIQW